jgi:hypothetical protein
VGYYPSPKGYKCYHPPMQKHFVTMDVNLFESHIYFSSTQTYLHKESLSEEKFSMSSPLLVPNSVPKHDNSNLLTDINLLLMSCMSHQWMSCEFTRDTINVRPFQRLLAKHLTPTRVLLFLSPFNTLQYLGCR